MNKESTPLEKNWLEWIVFAGGCVMVAGVLGYLVYSTVALGSSPPDIQIKLGEVRTANANFLVPVEVYNDGDQTAAGVQIEVVLEQNGQPPESANFEAAFLPRHSSREGAVAFKSDPRAGKLTARVLGYEKP